MVMEDILPIAARIIDGVRGRGRDDCFVCIFCSYAGKAHRKSALSAVTRRVDEIHQAEFDPQATNSPVVRSHVPAISDPQRRDFTSPPVLPRPANPPRRLQARVTAVRTPKHISIPFSNPSQSSQSPWRDAPLPNASVGGQPPPSTRHNSSPDELASDSHPPTTTTAIPLLLLQLPPKPPPPLAPPNNPKIPPQPPTSTKSSTHSTWTPPAAPLPPLTNALPATAPSIMTTSPSPAMSEPPQKPRTCGPRCAGPT